MTFIITALFLIYIYSPHIHCIFWIKDAPKYGETDVDTVTKYIDKYITCEKGNEEDDLSHLVKRQIHRHSHTCKIGNKSCRFNYPLPPMRRTEILEPLEYEAVDPKEMKALKLLWNNIHQHLQNMNMGESITFDDFLIELKITEERYINAIRSSLKTATVFLKREPSEIRVNAYNKSLCFAWRANMDIQFVLNIYACARYVASYVTKSQRGISELLRKAASEVKHGNQTIKEQLKQVGGKFVNSVEMSAQEAAYIILGLPMKKASRVVRFVNTNLPQDRVFLVKAYSELSVMDDESEDIAQKSILDNYEARSAEMEAVTLAEYVAWYEKKFKRTDRRQKSKITSDGFLPENKEATNEDDIDKEDVDEDSQLSSLTKRKVR